MSLNRFIFIAIFAAFLIPFSGMVFANIAAEKNDSSKKYETLLEKRAREDAEKNKQNLKDYYRAQRKLETYEHVRRLYEQDIEKAVSPEGPSNNSRSEAGLRVQDLKEPPGLHLRPALEAEVLPNSGYILGPGDKLKIIVYGEKDLSGTYSVNDAGQISFPLIGEAKVSGLQVLQARDLLISKLQQGYLRDPNIAIEVEEFRPFYIIGEIRKPGSYRYVAGMSVLNAVALAGGFTYRANQDEVDILRQSNGEEVFEKDSHIESKVFPGDIITVRERFF